MTTHTAGRQCGNCGTAVPADAVTCPACDALLAAYEAPSGSDAAEPTPTLTALEPNPVTPASKQPPAHAASDPVLTRSPEAESASFSADAALAEARRTLGMTPAQEPVGAKPDPAPESRVPTTPAPTAEEHAASTPFDQPAPADTPEQPTRKSNEPVPQLQRRGRKLGPPPERPLSRPMAEPIGRAGMAQQPVASAPTPSPQTASAPAPEGQAGATPSAPVRTKDHPIQTITHLLIIGVFAFFFLSIVRSFPFGVSPFIMIVFAIVILSHLMRIVAGATGRKTTTMRDPNNRSGWKR